MEFLSQLRAFIVSLPLCIFIVACNGAPNNGAGSDEAGSDVEVIRHTSTSAEQLVLLGQGGEETTTVTFAATSANGIPLRGRSVEFSLSSTLGGVSLSNSSGQTGEDGSVSVVLQSGTVSTTVRVTATLSGTDIRAVSEDITIASSLLVSGRMNIGLVLQSGVIETRDLNDPETPNDPTDDNLVFVGALTINGIDAEAQVIANDRFGNPVFEGLRVSLWSPEFGLIASSCDLEGGVCQADLISAAPRPLDGRVSIIAYGTGAEEFFDLNGNNIYDEGEPWIDLPEAYLDENEDGQYNLGEFFVDSNSDGLYNAEGNNVWDGPCGSYCPGESSTIVWDIVTFTIVAPDPEE